MTLEAAAGLHEEEIEVAARELSQRHALSDSKPRPVPSWSALPAMADWMRRARSVLSEADGALAKAAEWFLDNEYLVQRAVLQVREHLPAGFYARLPALGTDAKPAPRIFAVACCLAACSRMQLTSASVVRFLAAYQRSAPLATAELWALPTALRLVSLEMLVASLERLEPQLAAPFELSLVCEISLDDTECVARSLGTLRSVDAISWKDVFGQASVVQRTLGRDPAGVYASLDFETADRYRRAIEELASGTAHSELEVAERVVAFSKARVASDPRRGHVGFWLVGAGREEFERSLGFRPRARERLHRLLQRHAALSYELALAGATLAALALPAVLLVGVGANGLQWLFAALVLPLPASVLGITVVHWLLTRLLPPRVLSKLDFSEGIPVEWKTAVVVPALAASPGEAAELLEQLEAHYLANPDPSAEFVLLSDFRDASTQTLPDDAEVLRILVAGIRRLNGRHPDGSFHVLHRERLHNPSEGRWMGWERKRGKLELFNRLVLGDARSGFSVHEGRAERLGDVRFVVTLDADTALPRGALARLAGILAHPLNRPEFEERSGRVTAGYTVVQPRVEIDPRSGNRSGFARLFSGDTAIDIYSHAVSDVYHDLFGSGIYVGKGIYDVAGFHRSLEGRVPENALASHDLFEGVHGRAALATDVVLYESFPAAYLEFARRLHRWVRGDWQLLPWLFRRVPGPGGARLENPLSGLDRWKILDNLRRSLVSPALLAMLVSGWLLLPGSPWLWTVLGVLAPAGHLFTDLVIGLGRGRRRSALRGTLRRFHDHAGRWLLLVVFLPHEALVTLDAIGRTLFRLFVSRRGLIEWTTAAHTARAFADGASRRSAAWREMSIGPLTAAGVAGALAAARPDALGSAALLLGLWAIGPEIAHRLARPLRSQRAVEIAERDRGVLRALARRTWLFFETFAGPEDQWLPPDNFQEDPRGALAHRTSPTNIGMMFLASLAAWDLGYLGAAELAARLRSSFGSLKRLERHRGHLLNWYDTRSLEPLEPRYVSTVDSGNLAASLLALKEGCAEIAAGAVLRRARWEGIVDVLGLLESALERLPGSAAASLVRQQRELAASAATRAGATRWTDALASLQDGKLDAALREVVSRAGEDADLPALHDLQAWTERLHHQVHHLQHDTESLAPWLPLLAHPPAAARELATELGRLLPVELRLEQVEECCTAVRDRLERAELEGGDATEWIGALREAVERGAQRGAELRGELFDVAARAEGEALGMDFRPLYDPERRLFRIGYNASVDQFDPHHYDLLASEARIASFVAIAKGDVPVEHWFHLGRPITSVGRSACLVSWGGSMFEYLMPALLLRSEPGTLLSESERAAIEAQRRFGAELAIPWGVSESGFAALDGERSYRYRAFGVPGLGLRRGLADERVVAPYATILALAREPEQALRNLARLESLGLLGLYGLYEAADFTPDRIPEAEPFVAVRSYMAHHQGMILAALDNLLCNGALLARFASDRRVRSVQVLLHERVPQERPPERLPAEEIARRLPERRAAPALQPWSPREGSVAEVHTVGNGRLASWLTDTGAGGLLWQDHWVTRWSPDPAHGGSGPCLYARDEATGEQWSVAPRSRSAERDERLLFHPHMAELQQRRAELGIHLEVVVAPADDVELRRITLVNESDRARTITLTSYAEVALARAADVERHPTFSRLFVRSERADRGALLFCRRARDPGERSPVMLQRLIADDPGVELVGFETDRTTFVGRGNDPRAPQGHVRSSEASTGFTLDPVSVLQVRAEIGPNETRRLALATVVAGSRETLLETAERFQTMGAVDWVIADAANQAAREMQQLGLDSERAAELQLLASLLLHPHRALRAGADLLESNRSDPSQLWGLGLSGDLPILLVRTRAPEESEFLRDLIRGHRLWWRRGLKVDLVVLRAGASGYAEPVGERIVELLRELGASDQLGLHGGVHFLAADQIGEARRRLLEVAARVVLDATEGSLGRQLARALQPPSELPAFTPSGWPIPREPTPELERPSDLRHDNGTGGFSADGSEYVIFLEPGRRTPAPWSNVLANEDFGCLVTESGGGFTWAGNSAENRLTPWSNDPVSDPVGEALYLRDEEDGELWTPTPAPTGAAVAHEIRHGAGYTRWRSRSHGLHHELTVFVPKDDPVKLIRLRVENLWSRPRRITATYYAEWVLGTTRSATSPFLIPEYESEQRALLVRNPWNRDFAERVAFLAASREPHGLTTDREEFLGRIGGPQAPAALRRWGLGGRVEAGVDPCAAYQVHLELGANASEEVVFALGEGRNRDEALALLRRWRDPRNAAEALEAVRAFWDDLLGSVQIRTPEPALDLLVNRWLLYQALASRVFARTGFYQSSGAIGFRDQLQDLLAAVHVAPERLRAHLLGCARRQFEEGDVLHWWHPPSGRGVRTRCSDDLLWLPYATAHYVEATGDASILDEAVPFLRAPPLSPEEADRFGSFEAGESASLFEHCERALERGVTRGPHGLPLIGAGDWNDGMNRMGVDGVGESVWLAWFAISAMRGFAELCARRKDAELERHWRARAAELVRCVEAHGWDGEWYRRAFDDDGHVWGSRSSEECRIDSVPQSWAALSRGAQRSRARQALEAAAQELAPEEQRIVRLLWPPFHATPRDPGYIKAYPPGIRENGGQYMHAAAWLAWAFAELGDGDEAARLLRLLSPIPRTSTPEDAERYRGEPYVVAGDVGSVPPHAGRAGWTWYTGSASWIWRLAVEGILGVQRSEGGVRLRPCLPKDWGRAEVIVRGPKGSLRISIEDPEGLGTGATQILVDGTASDEPVAIPTDGGEHCVEVRIGAPPGSVSGR